MEEPATIAMSQKSRELRAAGKDIISLSLGEPDFHTPEFIKEAAVQALKDNYTTYTPVAGYDDLRESIALKFKRDNGLVYTKDQIVVSTGAKQSIANVVLSVMNKGDEAIIPAPYWVSYIEMVKVAEGIPVVVKAGIENDFKITGEQLRSAITSKTRMFIFSSPCNPTGTVYSKEELEELALVLKDFPQIVVLSDEIYEHINFKGGHQSIAQFDYLYPQVVTVNGMSKAWAMTGWRLGYIGAPLELAKACSKVQGQFTSGTCSITQRASITALKADPAILEEMIQTFKKRRDKLLEGLSAIQGIKVNHPEGAFYVFPDISYFLGKSVNGKILETADDLCLYLLDEAWVALVTGEAFGAPNCIRLSYATSDDLLEEAIRRLQKAFNKIEA